MRPNLTSVKEFLPKNTWFSKNDLNNISKKLGKPLCDINREDSESIAKIYLLQEKERKLEDLEKKKIEIEISELYRICVPFKVDCYTAGCRFMEIIYSKFIETPDRIPIAPYKESDGHFFNKILQKTGYHEKSCACIMKDMGIKNHLKFILDNHKEDFIKFIHSKHKVLNKHFRIRYVDYSHLAYNGVSNDF